MGGEINVWVYGKVEGCIDGSMDRWKDWSMGVEGWIDASMGGSRDGWMHLWVGEGKDRWMVYG